MLSKWKDNVSKAAQHAQQLITTVQKQTQAKLENMLIVPNESIDTKLTGKTLPSSKSSESIRSCDNLKQQEQLLLEFHSICDIIDSIGQSDNALSFSADKTLNDSSLKIHFNTMLLLLQSESDSWFEKTSLFPDQDISLLPCLDVFIQTNVLQELCIRATKDIPRGTMPLLTSSIANLLKKLRYPILQHQAVHKPIAHLISFVCRYEALFGVDVQSQYYKSNELTNYKKRIEASLMSLLAVIWLKLFENIQLLDFFIIKDSKSSKLLSQQSFQPQLDVLTALIPLLESPTLSNLASETFLFAVSMHNNMIDSFILNYTSLIDDILSELIFSYEMLINYLISRSTTSNFQSITRDGLAFQTTYKQNFSEKKTFEKNNPVINKDNPGHSNLFINILERFYKYMKFYNSLVNNSSNEPFINGLESIKDNSPISLQHFLLKKFYNKFLFNTMQTYILSNSETSIISSCLTIRLVIQTLSNIVMIEPNKFSLLIFNYLFNRSNSLRIYFEDNNQNLTPNFPEILINHCMSISKDVSSSAMNLLIVLLECSPLHLSHSLFNSLSSNPSNSNNNSLTSHTVSSNVTINNVNTSYKYNSYIDERFKLIYSNKLMLLNTNISIDMQLSLLVDCVSTLSLDDLSSINVNKNPTNDTTWGMNEKDFNNLINVSFDNILSVISKKKTSNIANIRIVINKNNLLIYLLYNKINTMLSQKFDEQIITAAYIISVVKLISSYLTVCSNSEISDNCDDHEKVFLINVLVEILIAIDKLWVQLSIEYLSKIANVKVLANAIKSIFKSIYLRNKISNNSFDSNNYKIFDKEKQQIRRILETAVIISHLHFEIQSYIYAVRKVRNIIDHNNKIHKDANSFDKDNEAVDGTKTKTFDNWLITNIDLFNNSSIENTLEDVDELGIDNEHINKLKLEIYENKTNESISDLNENDFNIEFESLNKHLDEIIK